MALHSTTTENNSVRSDPTIVLAVEESSSAAFVSMMRKNQSKSSKGAGEQAPRACGCSALIEGGRRSNQLPMSLVAELQAQVCWMVDDILVSHGPYT